MEYAVLVPLIAFGRMVALPEPLRGYRARIHAASHRVESEMSRWDKFLFGLAIKRMVIRQIPRLDIPRLEAIELLWLGVRNFFVANWSRPKDHSVTIAGLRSVIFDLRNTCEERLQLIERLHRANEEQQRVIRGLLEENSLLRGANRDDAEKAGKPAAPSDMHHVSKRRFHDMVAPIVPTSISRAYAMLWRKH
jgi:hypothetical protein